MKGITMGLMVLLMIISLPYIVIETSGCIGGPNISPDKYNSIILEDHEGNELDEVSVQQSPTGGCSPLGKPEPVGNFPVIEQIVHDKFYVSYGTWATLHSQIQDNQLVNWEVPVPNLIVGTNETLYERDKIVGKFATYTNEMSLIITLDNNKTIFITPDLISQQLGNVRIDEVYYGTLDTSGHNLFFSAIGFNITKIGDYSSSSRSFQVFARYNIENNTTKIIHNLETLDAIYHRLSMPPEESDVIYGVRPDNNTNVLFEINLNTGETQQIYKSNKTILRIYHLADKVFIGNSDNKIIDPLTGNIPDKYRNAVTLNEDYIIRFNPEERFISVFPFVIFILILIVIVIRFMTRYDYIKLQKKVNKNK